MPNLGAPEIILILIVVLLLFGAKRMPDAARGLGRSLRIFKAETKGMNDDAKDAAAPAAPAAEIPPAATDTPPATPAPQTAPAPEPGADR
jgi:sec-independent protein translocase protein TatA